jgi:hypothetical protein
VPRATARQSPQWLLLLLLQLRCAAVVVCQSDVFMLISIAAVFVGEQRPLDRRSKTVSGSASWRMQ